MAAYLIEEKVGLRLVLHVGKRADLIGLRWDVGLLRRACGVRLVLGRQRAASRPP